MQESGNVNGNNTSKRSKILNNSRIIRFRYEKQRELLREKEGDRVRENGERKRERNII